jgi:hypothetical protein
VDVQQFSLETLHEFRRQDAHESGQGHERGAAGIELGAQCRLESGAVGKFPDGDDGGRHAERRGARQASGARPIGDHL